MKRILVLVSCLIIGLVIGVNAQVPQTGIPPRAPKGVKLPPQQKPPSNNWLADADNDADRFRKLEIYLRGMDNSMWEVGYRYQAVYDAIVAKNYALADYHWQKIKSAINGGLIKRPGRTQNSEAMFLDTIWVAMNEAIKSKDHDRVVTQFAAVRQICIACHAAEKVPFINDMKMFSDTASFPK